MRTFIVTFALSIQAGLIACSEGPVAAAGPGRTFTVQFTLPPAATAGDAVRIGEAVVGRVVSVSPIAPEDPEGVPTVGVQIFIPDDALAQPTEATYGVMATPWIGPRSVELVIVDPETPRLADGAALPGVGSAVERVAVESRLRATAAYRQAQRSLESVTSLETELREPLEEGARAAGQKLRELGKQSGDAAKDALGEAREAAGEALEAAGAAVRTVKEQAREGLDDAAAATSAAGEAAVREGREALKGAKRLGVQLIEELKQ